MKKSIALIILIICVIMTTACNQSSAGKNRKADEPVKGEMFENEFFSMAVAKGFEKMDIDGGVQVYKGNKFIEVSFRGFNQSDTEAETSANILANRYNGATPEKVDMLGLTFFKTVIIVNNTPQTVYLAMKGGKKINISIFGKGHENDGELQGMFQSIKLK